NRQRWRQWIDSHRGQPRDVWLASGFTTAGYRVQRIHQKHLWELVRAVAGPEHLSFNAQRSLARLTAHEPERTDWSRDEACRYWLRHLDRRRGLYRLSRPPAKLRRRCL
ncbi:MAG: hypothetical protein JRI23_18265, partial [Deltaproteobacteria bacterium]|nr:hypothetical protein [Deltaproteobacteria bacterium]MBW2533800.1 hypothetical protein [Deltaproteobacteria bacterium]